MMRSGKETNPYKQKHDFAARSAEARRIRKKYSEQYPVIVLRGKRCKLPPLDKNKFIVSGEMTLAQFQQIIRSRSNLAASQSIFVYVENDGKFAIPETSKAIRQLYQDFGDDDGFLYLTYHHDDAFGASALEM
ncbi:uncharacterized protein MONBRDRAFT_32501 [Monosiga brevicollis MX1]|uniref:Autophagy-related protein n=1 Tax=Monosiga brevicollis TaxID=81824 RepID=A9UZW9_MONBE|nr:uncharacterized protein MONBRDRAFT_32501 [Monosiga brevicollis MX1]EDQ89050.1 predicted protein [Monosiga brevicollis MX1]|eukprot:XP_001746155.1 hypothetical protein [Monosiga brevicollis MX1]